MSKNRGFNISGACYPEVHQEAANMIEDIQNLKKKVDSGADHLISQLFFDNQVFFDFQEKARIAGINVPIEAGIMPVTNKKQIERMVSMCGASIPAKLSKVLQRFGDNHEAMRDAGISYAIDQIIELAAHGVDGVHIYTMNDPYVARRISEGVKNILKSGNKMSEQRNIIIDNIDFSEALRYLGYGNSTPDEKTKEILYNCADQLKSVMEGKYTYKVFDLVDGQVPGINFTLEGKSIANHLKNCEKVIFMCATLSAGVDGLIRKMQIRGMADAMFTDSLASAVIEQVCNKAEDEILEDFKEYEHTWRFGLGYGDFPLTGQKQFLDILDAGRRIGVCVNSGMTLVPTKSVTCIIGLGHNLEVSNVKSCDLCNFREKCTFRKDGKNCGK